MFWTSLLLTALTFSQAPAQLAEQRVHEDVIAEASSPSQRISGGWQAFAGQFPYAVYLDVIPSSGFLHNCVGSIVHREWVITAASCVRNSRSVFVRAGFTVIASTPAYHNDASEIIIHPSFDPTVGTNNQRTDIALLKMTVPFVYTRLIQRIQIQLGEEAFADFTGQLLTACGWGRVSGTGALPPALLFVNLGAITNQACTTVYGAANVFDTHICTRGFTATAQSICPSDSGAPLARIREDGEPTLIGVGVFWDSRSCDWGNPAGFIRPGAFEDWINEVTGLIFGNLTDAD